MLYTYARLLTYLSGPEGTIKNPIYYTEKKGEDLQFRIKTQQIDLWYGPNLYFGYIMHQDLEIKCKNKIFFDRLHSRLKNQKNILQSTGIIHCGCDPTKISSYFYGPNKNFTATLIYKKIERKKKQRLNKQ